MGILRITFKYRNKLFNWKIIFEKVKEELESKRYDAGKLLIGMLE